MSPKEPSDRYKGLGRWLDTDELFTEAERVLILQLAAHLDLVFWSASGEQENFAIHVWSPGAEKMYGIPKSEAIGANYLDLFVNPTEREQAQRDHSAVERTGRAYRNVAMDKVRNITTNEVQSRILLTEGIAP